MKKTLVLSIAVFISITSFALADTFASGTANEFNIDFVPISGITNPTSGIPAGDGFTFTGVSKDYRMGTKEITNDQWNKFKAAYGAVTGSEPYVYDQDPYWAGSSVPTNNLSWYEAAQFVNWLNTSNNYQPAYKFTGEIHTSTYTLGVWGSQDADGTNLYRNKNAKYFLPTENEWVKAAYWNGTALQTYATKAGQSLTQGNDTSGTGWNYYNGSYAINPYELWAVGSGSQELNGTYDMMGNVWEWMESAYYTGEYLSGSSRGLRGGSFRNYNIDLASSSRGYYYPLPEHYNIGFRVASIVPEPCSLALLGLGGLVLRRGRK